MSSVVWREEGREPSYFAYLDGSNIGRVSPWYLPQGSSIWVAEWRDAKGGFRVQDFNSVELAKAAIEAAHGGRV